MSKEELAFIPTNDLLDELFARFDSAVFKAQKQEDSDNKLELFKFDGEHTICSGLCNDLIYLINKDRDDVAERLDDAP